MPTARRALIAGLGLIGGSIGLALRSRGWRVLFIDSDLALDAGTAADARATSLHDDADVVVLATPVDAAEAMLRALDGRLVTSVCSVMSPLRAIGGEQFVAGHPLAGSQDRGVAAARADLFEGATWFVDRDEPLVNALIADCGARPELVDAATHDRALAMTSHLPQVLSTALAAYLSGENVDPRFAGPGLRTFLRLAASEASVWMPTLEANRGNVQPHIDGVAAIARAVADGDAEPFARAHEFFNRLS